MFKRIFDLPVAPKYTNIKCSRYINDIEKNLELLFCFNKHLFLSGLCGKDGQIASKDDS